jgi:Peptidase family M23
MRINKPLRFLVITGAFLSANAGLAQNSFSTEQVLVASNTSPTQLLGSDRVADSNLGTVSSTTDPENRDPRFGFDEDRSPSLVGARPTQSSLFVSDVATIGRDRRIAGAPLQNKLETAIDIPVPNRPQSEASVEIFVPLPRTQIIKVQPVARLPRFVKTSPIPSVSALPSVRPGSMPLSQPTSFATNNTTNVASSDLIYPLMTPAPITSRFGWRTHPLTGTRRFHSGLDIGAPSGTPVVATATGTVISAGWNGGYGKAIIIQHNDVQQTLYGHLSEISVQPGQVIEQGTVIGLVGSTGNSTGPHLHFETRMPNGNTWVAIDPSEDIQYAVDSLRKSMPFARKDIPQGL